MNLRNLFLDFDEIVLLEKEAEIFVEDFIHSTEVIPGDPKKVIIQENGEITLETTKSSVSLSISELKYDSLEKWFKISEQVNKPNNSLKN